MIARIQILSIVASVLVIILIVYLIRRKKLREEYSLMWLGGSLVLIVFSIWRRLLEIIAGLVGVYYAPVVLLLVGIFFGVLIFLHLTVVISKQADQNKIMAQEIALLKGRVDELTASRAESDS
jgi:hypothetical protein